MSSSIKDGEWEWEMIPPQSSSTSSSSAPSPSSPLEISSPPLSLSGPGADTEMEPETESTSNSSRTQSSISQRNPHSFSEAPSSVASSSSPSFASSSIDPESQLPLPLSTAASTSSPSSSSATASTSSSGPAEEKMCRICQSDEDPASMISPCKCRGSMRYVHIECLDRWRKTSANPRSFFQCDQCLFKYQFSRAQVGNALKSSVAKHALTIAVLFLLITLSGYVGKILFPLFESLPEVEVDEEGNIIPANVTADAAAASLSAAQRLWEFLRIDLSHMLLGTFLVGVGGFISLFAAGPVRGGFYWGSTGARSSSAGGKSTGEMIFLGVIVLIGLIRAGYLIYRKIEDRSERVLLNARDMVVNIQAD